MIFEWKWCCSASLKTSRFFSETTQQNHLPHLHHRCSHAHSKPDWPSGCCDERNRSSELQQVPDESTKHRAAHSWHDLLWVREKGCEPAADCLSLTVRHFDFSVSLKAVARVIKAPIQHDGSVRRGLDPSRAFRSIPCGGAKKNRDARGSQTNRCQDTLPKALTF